MDGRVAVLCVLAACGSTDDHHGSSLENIAAPEVTVKVTARKWTWDFEYETGLHSAQLRLPAGVPTALDITSDDVVHTLEIPALGVKQDATPGRSAHVVIVAPTAGDLPMQCTAACGMGPGQMEQNVLVQAPPAFDRWLAEETKAAQGTPAEIGARVYQTKGCKSCHAIDGTKIVGAPLDHRWGKTITLTDGRSVVIDAAVVRGAIAEPMKWVEQGYRPVMPRYEGNLSDAEIDGLAAYMESLK